MCARMRTLIHSCDPARTCSVLLVSQALVFWTRWLLASCLLPLGFATFARFPLRSFKLIMQWMLLLAPYAEARVFHNPAILGHKAAARHAPQWTRPSMKCIKTSHRNLSCFYFRGCAMRFWNNAFSCETLTVRFISTFNCNGLWQFARFFFQPALCSSCLYFAMNIALTGVPTDFCDFR